MDLLFPARQLDAGERDALGDGELPVEHGGVVEHRGGLGPPRGGAAEHRHAAQLAVGRGRSSGPRAAAATKSPSLKRRTSPSRGHAGEAPRASGATRAPRATPRVARARRRPPEARSDGGGTRGTGREARATTRRAPRGAPRGGRGRAENGRHARATRATGARAGVRARARRGSPGRRGSSPAQNEVPASSEKTVVRAVINRARSRTGPQRLFKKTATPLGPPSPSLTPLGPPDTRHFAQLVFAPIPPNPRIL